MLGEGLAALIESGSGEVLVCPMPCVISLEDLYTEIKYNIHTYVFRGV